MPRVPRDLQPNYTYHITLRCNNRRFNLNRLHCREVFLYAIERAKEKYDFKLFALCIMSNHVHYLIEPADPEDLPRIMHWLDWYTAMALNRMLNRTGHFWEQRYYSSGFPTDDYQRALDTLRYIHANPKAAGICQGFHYRYSNYGTYADLADDGLTEWHPAFFSLGQSLDECAAQYRRFCQGYAPQSKPGGRHSAWGRQALPDVMEEERANKQLTRSPKEAGQLALPWLAKPCQVQNPAPLLEAAQETARRFAEANLAGRWA